MSFFERVFPRFFHGRAIKRLKNAIESGALDLLLEGLLNAMRLACFVCPDYRKHIDGFDGRYAFVSADGRIAASAVFLDGRMAVEMHEIGATNVTITFRDAAAMRNLLLDPDPDIIAAILDNQVTYEGNLNYLAKFAFMAKNLQRRFAF